MKNLFRGESMLTGHINMTHNEKVNKCSGTCQHSCINHLTPVYFISVQALFNNKAYHAMPTFLSVATNTLLREKVAAQGKDPRLYGKFLFQLK